MQRRFVSREGRKGVGLLPPNPIRWEQEHNGLDVRKVLGVGVDSRLDLDATFGLLEAVIDVIPHTALPLDPITLQQAAGAQRAVWSGMCVPIPGSGEYLVVYNAEQPMVRTRATLMEEFFHLWLGHPPTVIRAYADGHSRRDFDSAKESEAYGSGAAALVPYKGLKAMLERSAPVVEIARHYEVSEPLVEFRIKVSKLSRLRTAAA